MNIFLVTNGFPPTAFGGVEVHSYDLARSLVERGHTVTVFCRESDASLPDYHKIQEEIEGVDVIRVVNDYKEISSFTNTYRDPEIERLFKDYVERIQPDLVHFNHWIALSATLPHISNQLNIPSVAFLHDYWAICHRVHLMDWKGNRCPGPEQGGDCFRCVVSPEKLRAWMRIGRRWAGKIKRFALRKRLRQTLLRDSGRIIAFNTSPEDFDQRIRIFQDNLKLTQRVFVPSDFVRQIFIQNGFVDLEMDILPLGIKAQTPEGFTPSFPDKIQLVFIGTLLPSKGAHILLRALRLVKEDVFHLRLYGRQDADPRYFRRLKRLSRGDKRIQFEGPFPVDQRAENYKKADVVIIPSLVHETYSLVAREALSSGTPVIASRVGALTEIIHHGENGFLIPPGDHQALASLLREISKKPMILTDLDLPGPNPIVTDQDHIDFLERIYRELLSEA